ncbi:DUF3868 domain-containing protein [Bacteroides ovatus]|nr:DUF3868 domain-containing protein [Bacteroides ovatus]
MAKLKSFLYLLIIFLTISSLSYGEENPKKWYTGIIQPTALELQQAGDSLHIQILYNFDNIQVSSNHSIELIPVLIAANHQMELPEISIKGRKNYQNLKRKLALMNTQERAFLPVRSSILHIKRVWNDWKRTDSVLVDNSIRAMDEGCISECKERSDGLLQARQVTISYSSF